MLTPVQIRERHKLSANNSRISQLGDELRANQNLDRQYYTSNSLDTRRSAKQLRTAVGTRSALKGNLEKRLTSWNSTPAQKDHADRLLREIRSAQNQEEIDRIRAAACVRR